MDYRKQCPTGLEAEESTSLRQQKKTAPGMIEAFNALWDRTRPAFRQQRTHERARRLAVSSLLCLGRHTITGLISASGYQMADWSADFRLFERNRFDPAALFQVPREAVLQNLAPHEPYVVFMDDTVLRKRGRKMAGTSWRRDPLGPAFHTNFIWGQRFLQLSAALPDGDIPSRTRAVPIDLLHCPTPRKPSRRASPEEWEQYRQAQKETNIAQRGVERLGELRRALDQTAAGRSRPMVASVDGSFTNRTVLKALPPRTVLIGRIRKDAKLYTLPSGNSCGRGRKRTYGDRMPTPEELRQDESVPWQTIPAYAAGKTHQFSVKTMAPVRWRNAGGEYDLRIVAIRPLAYRLSKQSRLLYRKPVYLLCTDPDYPLHRLIQYYVWRWEIEMNFRDEKTLLGMEQAQVRTPNAVASVPIFTAASYAMLLLAGAQVKDLSQTLKAVTPKWRKVPDECRPSVAQLISLFRKEFWGLAIPSSHFSGFVSHATPTATPQKLKNSLHNAVFFAHG